MVRMKVKVVGLEQHTLNPVVIITDPDETGYLPILIGPSEAYAISQGLEGKRMPRPMTHDLLKTRSRHSVRRSNVSSYMTCVRRHFSPESL